MKIKDCLYGENNIDDPVIIELLNCPTFLRLKDITQAGVPQKYNSLITYSRYEHSIGVMLLLRRLSAPLEEQVAGLLHDISHLAFSHVAEWVFRGSGGEDDGFNETLTKKFIYGSEIKHILKRYRFNIKKTCDLKGFPLLESELPDLSADRADYSAREIHKWISRRRAISYVDGFRSDKRKIFFEDPELAADYADEVLTLQTEYWGSHDAVFRYYLFSEILKYLVSKKRLCFKNFFGKETPIIKLLERTKLDEPFSKYLKILGKKNLSPYKNMIGISQKKYFRYVDPLVYQDKKFLRVSQIDKRFAQRLVTEKEKATSGVRI